MFRDRLLWRTRASRRGDGNVRLPGGFDPEDIDDSLIKIEDEIKSLPQKYAELLDVFKNDQEQV